MLCRYPFSLLVMIPAKEVDSFVNLRRAVNVDPKVVNDLCYTSLCSELCNLGTFDFETTAAAAGSTCHLEGDPAYLMGACYRVNAPRTPDTMVPL